MAQAALVKQLDPYPPSIVAIWYMDGIENGLTCGEVEATPPIRSQQATLRFIVHSLGSSAVEPHMVAGDATGAAIAAETASLFESMWSKDCQPYAPLGRRIAGWFHRDPSSDAPDTPITNDHVEQLLGNRR